MPCVDHNSGIGGFHEVERGAQVGHVAPRHEFESHGKTLILSACAKPGESLDHMAAREASAVEIRPDIEDTCPNCTSGSKGGVLHCAGFLSLDEPIAQKLDTPMAHARSIEKRGDRSIIAASRALFQIIAKMEPIAGKACTGKCGQPLFKRVAGCGCRARHDTAECMGRANERMFHAHSVPPPRRFVTSVRTIPLPTKCASWCKAHRQNMSSPLGRCGGASALVLMRVENDPEESNE